MIKSFFDKEKHNSINWLTQELTLQIGNKHFILSRTAPQTEKKTPYLLSALTEDLWPYMCSQFSLI
jgi:hypothetical protein